MNKEEIKKIIIDYSSGDRQPITDKGDDMLLVYEKDLKKD